MSEKITPPAETAGEQEKKTKPGKREKNTDAERSGAAAGPLVSLFPDSSYKVHLSEFDGPLDLLLHLIKEAKIDIKNIFISKITEQYLEYMSQLDDLDLERASEFLEMAATLLEIKSKSMLPKVEEIMEAGESDENRLMRQLEEYKLIKEASEKLHTLENVNRFYKAPDESVSDYRYILKALNIEGLLNAFSMLLHKVEKESAPVVPKEIKKDRFTVAEKMIIIKDVILRRRVISFFELFDRDYSKSEIINTFLALLELLKMQLITAEQAGTYEDITLKYNDNEVNGNGA